MTYDPAWDMPKASWQQQGSYQEAIPPLEYQPDDGPLVCLPPINQYWLPLVLGCLDQLCNPSTWLASDDASLNTALEQAQALKQMFGVRVECVSYKVRFDPSTCQLQESEDAGVTWTEVEGWEDFEACLPPQTLVSYDEGCVLSESFDAGATYTPVPGWIDNFSTCVQKYTPIIGLPPNPGDQTKDQLSCSIATYITEQVVVAAIGKAVTAISDDLTLLQFGLDVVNIIPEFVLVTLAVNAFSAIYVAVQEGTLSDFEDALTDSTLRSDMICAIYGCIAADGYVTPDNFDCVVTAVSAITSSTSGVVAAIASYIEALGPTGLAQLSQIAGLESGADCSACNESWCYEWGPAKGDLGADWQVANTFGEFDGTEWVSTDNGAGGQALYIVLEIDDTFHYTSGQVGATGIESASDLWRFFSGTFVGGVIAGTLVADFGATEWSGSVTGANLLLISSSNIGEDTIKFGDVLLRGSDLSNPFGDSNCEPL